MNRSELATDMTSEEVVQRLLDFVSETGRLPKSDEPGLEELISTAVKTFGSLQNALSVAGLLTDNHGVTTRQRKHSLSGQKAKLKRSIPTYPQDYFLNLLNLKQPHFQGRTARDGAPTWWERRANAQYACSACRKPIEKGERYIGRKKLNPGMRGKYGYRGTYSTDYYHIVCLLRGEEAQIKENIGKANSEISDIEIEITEHQNTALLNKDSIKACHYKIQQVKEEYEQTQGSLKKISKWFKLGYTSWTRNREISRLEGEITNIENREIPDRQNRIVSLRAGISSLQRRLNEIEARVQEIVSAQSS
jgi:hypothetical protein